MTFSDESKKSGPAEAQPLNNDLLYKQHKELINVLRSLCIRLAPVGSDQKYHASLQNS